MKRDRIIKFKEQLKKKSVSKISPNYDDNIIGTHTLNPNYKITVVDDFLKRKRGITFKNNYII